MYQIPSQSRLSPQRKSTFPLDYLSGYKCFFLARDLQPVYHVLQQTSSSECTFVNRLTIFKLTIWLEWMGASLILSTKRIYRSVGWWSPEGNSSMGDMLNFGYGQWVAMEYHPYKFSAGNICVVAFCNVEFTVCIFCGMRSLFLLRICDSFNSVFRVGSFFTLE